MYWYKVKGLKAKITYKLRNKTKTFSGLISEDATSKNGTFPCYSKYRTYEVESKANLKSPLKRHLF
jgi:hypothetical protein